MGLRTAASLFLAALATATSAQAANPTEVVLVKRAGVIAYEEVTEAFQEGCRVRARVVNLTTDPVQPMHFHPHQLVITVGQEPLDEEVITVGACFRYRPGTVHRVTALEDTTILEVSTPHLDDVVRLEDRYGREGTSNP